jgi:hypothetical protein
MFTLISGVFVHGDGTQNEQLVAAMTKHAPPLATAVPGVSAAVAQVVDRSLTFDKNDRWQSATEMQAGVRHAYANRGRAVLAVPPSVPNRTLPIVEPNAARGAPFGGQPGGGAIPLRAWVAAAVIGAAMVMGILAAVIVVRTRAAPPTTTPSPLTAVSSSASAGPIAEDCSLVLQKCGAGQTCIPTTPTHSVCINATGNQARGHRCVQHADCAPGNACRKGACRPFCSPPDSPCQGIGLGNCYPINADDHEAIPNVGACRIPCDVTDPDACGGCVSGVCAGCNLNPDHQGLVYTSDCQKVGHGTDSTSCQDNLDCAPGFTCNDESGGASYCRRFCKPPGECLASDTCQAALGMIDGRPAYLCLPRKHGRGRGR